MRDECLCFSWFPSEVKRVFSDEYLPTDRDILQSRVTTQGVQSCIFELPEVMMKVTDVSGLKSLRNKWLMLFSDINAIFYVVSLTAYWQKTKDLAEGGENAMLESLAVFESVVNSKLVAGVPIILFLNKIDLLKKYLKTYPLKAVFPDYSGEYNNEIPYRIEVLLFLFILLYRVLSQYGDSHCR